jgi:S1-C subfamily serine protease
MKATLAIVAAAAAAGGLGGAVVGLALDGDVSGRGPARVVRPGRPQQPARSAATSPLGLTATEIYRKDAPAVVVITATQTQRVPATFFTPPMEQQVRSLGSGFIIDKRGDIVTNHHVVQGAKGIRVGFSSGASYPATLVGTDPSTDVAVVRVKAPASALHPLAFGGAGTIEVGDPVYAIGNPFGLDRTMTAGIVSATGRDFRASNGLAIPNAIQIDAPINHGNSGGPLLDRFGRVIGVNAQIEGGTIDANVGVGFAIPGETARSVAAQLIARGHAEHAWLGVQVETIDPSVAEVVLGLPSHGVVVARVVARSPAAKAGLEAATRQVSVKGVSALLGGDTIVAVDGKPIGTSQQLADAVAARKPGDRLALDVVRAGKSRKVEITLGNVPSHT